MARVRHGSRSWAGHPNPPTPLLALANMCKVLPRADFCQGAPASPCHIPGGGGVGKQPAGFSRGCHTLGLAVVAVMPIPMAKPFEANLPIAGSKAAVSHHRYVRAIPDSYNQGKKLVLSM